MFNQQLPFPIDRINGQWIQGLPYRPPYVPRLRIDPQLEQFIRPATGYFMHELQTNAEKNALRVFLYNQMFDNNCQNRDFEEAILSIIDYAEALTAQGQDPEKAIAAAAAEMAAILAVINAKKIPALAETLQTQQQQSDAERMLQRYQQIAGLVKEYQQHKQAEAHGWGRGTGGFGGGFGGGQQQGWGSPTPRGNAGFGTGFSGGSNPGFSAPRGNSAISQMAMSGGTGSGGFGQPTPTEDTSMGGWGRKSTQPEPEPTSFGAGPTEQIKWGGGNTPHNEPAYPEPNRSNVGKPEPFNVNWANDVPSKEEPPMQEATINYDEIHKPDGSVLRPAFKSGWVKTPTPNEPYTPAYDPTKEILYHRKANDGTVTEVFMNVNDDNEYLIYEMNPAFAEKVKADKHEKSRPDWDKITQAPGKMDDISEQRDRRLADPNFPEEEKELFEEVTELSGVAMTAASMDEARLGAKLTLISLYSEVPENQALRYTYYNCMPTLGDKDLLEKLRLLRKASNYRDLTEQFLELKDKMDSKVWYAVHDDMTRMVNEILWIGLGVKIKMASLIDDISDLIDILNTEKQYGEEYAIALDRTAKRVAQACTHVLTGEIRDQYVQRLEYPVSNPEVVNDILVLGSLNNVTEVPWYSSDMGIEVSDDGSAVLESKFPNLFKAIDHIFKRADNLKLHSFRHTWIVTADNVRLKLHRSELNDGFYLISK